MTDVSPQPGVGVCYAFTYDGILRLVDNVTIDSDADGIQGVEVRRGGKFVNSVEHYRISSIGKLVQVDHGSTFDTGIRAYMLRREGNKLRIEETDGEEPDEYTKRYEPELVLRQQLLNEARKNRTLETGPSDVNLWAKRVAQFVDECFPEYSDRIVLEALRNVNDEEIVAAIDQNLTILGLIMSDLDSRAT